MEEFIELPRNLSYDEQCAKLVIIKSNKLSYQYTIDDLLEWLQENPSYSDDQYHALNDSIFKNSDTMVLLSETMKHHNLWIDSLIYKICYEQNIIFFQFIFQDYEFTTKFNVQFLFNCIKNNNHEAIDMLLDRYPDIIYTHIRNTDSYGCHENILHCLGRSNNLNLFRIIAVKNPQALFQKWNLYYPLNYLTLNYLADNKFIEDLLDNTIRECLEYENDNSEYINMIYSIAIKCPTLTTKLIIFEKLKNHQIYINKLLFDFIELNYDKLKYEIIEILLRDYNADPNIIDTKYNHCREYEEYEEYDMNAVECACYNEEFEILLLLERYNGNLNNQKLVFECINHNNRQIVKYLRDNYNLDFNIMVRDNMCTFAINLFNYYELCNIDICKYIVDCDIDFSALNHDNKSFLHLWVKKRNTDVNTTKIYTSEKMNMIFKLIEYGVNPYHKDVDGDCFFNLKSNSYNKILIFTYDEYKILHEHGIDLTIPNGKNHNLLDILCDFRNKSYYESDNRKIEYNNLYNLFVNELNMTLSK